MAAERPRRPARAMSGSRVRIRSAAMSTRVAPGRPERRTPRPSRGRCSRRRPRPPGGRAGLGQRQQRARRRRGSARRARAGRSTPGRAAAIGRAPVATSSWSKPRVTTVRAGSRSCTSTVRAAEVDAHGLVRGCARRCAAVAELLGRARHQVVEVVDLAGHEVRDAAGRVAGARPRSSTTISTSGGPATPEAAAIPAASPPITTRRSVMPGPYRRRGRGAEPVRPSLGRRTTGTAPAAQLPVPTAWMSRLAMNSGRRTGAANGSTSGVLHAVEHDEDVARGRTA